MSAGFAGRRAGGHPPHGRGPLLPTLNPSPLPTPGSCHSFFTPCAGLPRHNRSEVMNVNELGRTGSSVMAAAVLAIVAASVRLYAQGSADTSTSIVGVWTLDKKLSDVGEERPHNGGGQRSRGGGGGGHGPAGFMAAAMRAAPSRRPFESRPAKSGKSLTGSAFFPRRLAGCRHPRPTDRATATREVTTPNLQSPNVLGVGSWKLRVDESYFERGSGRIWKRMSLLVVPLPPSMWNGARVAIVV